MTALNKQALREEFQFMQDHYSDPADRERQVIYIAAEALLDELDAAEKQNSLDVQIKARLCRESNSLHDRLHDAEKRIAELEARKLTVNLPAACADDEYFIDGVFQPLRYERDVERALRAAGIGVKDE